MMLTSVLKTKMAVHWDITFRVSVVSGNVKAITRLKVAPVLAGFVIVVTPVMMPTSVLATEWECGERSNLPLEGKNYCAAGDFRLAQARMVTIIDELMEKHRLVFGDAEDLQHAQKSFEAYRGYQCAAENKRIKEKPYYPMVLAQCKTRFTNIRIDELTHLLGQKL